MTRIHAFSTNEFDHWSQHNGEEFVHVLSDAIEIHSEFYAPFRLTLGESTYFDSPMKHLNLSISEEDAGRAVGLVSKKPVSAFTTAVARSSLQTVHSSKARMQPVAVESFDHVSTLIGSGRCSIWI